MKENLIEIKNLDCAAAGKRILKNLSLGAPLGEMTAIIGPNGAGKTTLIRCILGLLPYEGTVKIDSTEIKSLSSLEMSRRLSYMPSEINTIYDYKVSELIEMGRYRFGFAADGESVRPSVDFYAELVGVQSMLDRSVNSLSSGEKQMVYLAQALAQEAQALILDEPTNHLDINHAVKFFDVLSRLNRERGLTAVFVNHDINLAARYAGKVAAVKDGEIFAEGTPQEVITPENLGRLYGLPHSAPGFGMTRTVSGRPVVYIE